MSIKLSVAALLANAQQKLAAKQAELADMRKEYEDAKASYDADTLERWRGLSETFYAGQIALIEAAAYIDKNPDTPNWERLRELAQDAFSLNWYNLGPRDTPNIVYKQTIQNLEHSVRQIEDDIALLAAVHGPSITLTYDNQRFKYYTS